MNKCFTFEVDPKATIEDMIEEVQREHPELDTTDLAKLFYDYGKERLDKIEVADSINKLIEEVYNGKI